MHVAIAGLGHVGAAVIRLLQSNADLVAARAGQEIKMVAVSARDRSKTRACDLIGIAWVDDARDLAARGDIDTVIEMIGGASGIAHDIAEAALRSGKNLVTANKALIAAHGVELARLAEKANVQLSFEAAVCGGVPVVKMLREGLAANRISSLRGILNGTCNYILTRMETEGVDFSTALGEAQRLGYAEANPADDIDGIDSANKLAILSALAFSHKPDLESIFVEGIRHVTLHDLRDATAKNGRIKLLSIAECTASGNIIQRVQPVFVPMSEPIAGVGGAFNAVEIHGDFSGEILLQGQGAGTATAGAIVADLIDIARGNRSYAFGVAVQQLT